MRSAFGLIVLLLALALTGLLLKRQLGALTGTPSAAAAPGGGPAGAAPAGSAGAASPQQIEQQYKQSLEKALQTPRPGGDEP